MTPDRYQRVTELFDAARELSTAEREKLLRDASKGDTGLVLEVQRLLAYHDDHPDFLTSPIVTTELRQEAVDRLLQPQDLLLATAGGWRLHRLIGEGGFALVYLGEQQTPYRRKAAIKVLRQGAGPRTIQRLQAECQALALLNHPGIVGIIEAGQLDDGSRRPYIVMEFVGGEEITAYCRRSNPNLKLRVGLFLNACDAVQYAHLRGILHRDLKASNVMVSDIDGAPVVKIVDFGVAKALAEPRLAGEATITRDGELVGTLGYMSPEQLEGRADVRADVYALGALLYELCTGRLPIDVRNCSIVDAARRIRELPVTAASRTARGCRGDLDVILFKALAKDPERRYQSAGEFAADLRRYLAGDAILARRPSLAYLAHSYARRHRTAVAFTVALVLFALAGSGLLIAENARARHAEDRWAARVYDSLRREFTAMDARVGTIAERADIAESAYVDALDLVDRRPNETRYIDLAAEAYRQRSKIAAERGDPVLALRLASQARDWRARAVEREPKNATIHESLALDLVLVGDACFALGRLDEMYNWFKQSAAEYEVLAARTPGVRSESNLAWSYQRLSAAHLHAGRVAPAIDQASRSLEITDRLLEMDPKDWSALACARQTHVYLAALFDRQKEPRIAAVHSSMALRYANELAALKPENRETIVSLLHGWLADADRSTDRDAACQTYERGYEMATVQLGREPHNERLVRFAGTFAIRCARCALECEDSEAATLLTLRSLEHAEHLPLRSAFDLWSMASFLIEGRALFQELGHSELQLDCERRLRDVCSQMEARADAPLEYLGTCMELSIPPDGEPSE